MAALQALPGPGAVKAAKRPTLQPTSASMAPSAPGRAHILQIAPNTATRLTGVRTAP